MHLHVRLDRLEVHVDLALVVHRAARVELAVAQHRLERRRGPQLERLGRLHVVVAVEQRGGLCRARPATRRRPPGARRSAPPRRASCRVLRRCSRDSARRSARMSALCSGLGADARDAQRGLQVVDEAVAVPVEVFGEGVHHGAPWAVRVSGSGTLAQATGPAPATTLAGVRRICEDSLRRPVHALRSSSRTTTGTRSFHEAGRQGGAT